MGATGPRGRQPYGMPSAANRYHVARRASKDRPKIIILAIIVSIGGMFIYSTIFSHLLENILLGPNADPVQAANFNLGLANLDILSIPITLLAFLALLLYSGEAVIRAARRAPPPTCPRCGAIESAAVHFARLPIPSTGWAATTCPQCGHDWHSKL